MRSEEEAERDLRNLQRRLTAITDRYEQAQARRKFLGSTRATILFALVTAGVAFLIGSALM